MNHRIECGLMSGPVTPEAIAACAKKYTCDWTTYRTDFIVGQRKCMVELDCNASVNACVNDVALSLMPTPLATTYSMDCQTRNAECSMVGGGFAGDYCDGLLKNDAMLSKMSACLMQPCENKEVLKCFVQLTIEAETPCL